MQLKNSNILWLADYTVKQVPAGGAEITDSYILDAGKALGYTIRVVRPCDLRVTELDWADVAVFSNCYEFAKPARTRIMDTLPYIVYSHDSGRWMNVLKQHPQMFENALASIFLSPLHRDCFTKFLGSAENILCVPPHIPFEFYDKGHKRLNKLMFVGNIHDGKGVPEIIDFAKKNPDIVVDFYFNRFSGHLRSQLKRLPNCNLVGYVPKEKIHDNYNRYSHFIHIPQHCEAFGRAVGEAFLSGCDLVVNDRVGATSYRWDYATFREKTSRSHFLFWENLQNAIN